MPVKNGKVNGQDGAVLAGFYSDNGADAMLVLDLAESDEEHELNIGVLKEMARRAEIPIYAGGHIRRVEDVKKILYAGCQKAVLNYGRTSNVEMTEEVSKRFGADKIAFSISDETQYFDGLKDLGSMIFWSGSDETCSFAGALPVISICRMVPKAIRLPKRIGKNCFYYLTGMDFPEDTMNSIMEEI